MCECEHSHHFTGESHPYGESDKSLPVELYSLAPMKTSLGTFKICNQCRKTHLKGYLPPWEQGK